MEDVEIIRKWLFGFNEAEVREINPIRWKRNYEADNVTPNDVCWAWSRHEVRWEKQIVERL